MSLHGIPKAHSYKTVLQVDVFHLRPEFWCESITEYLAVPFGQHRKIPRAAGMLFVVLLKSFILANSSKNSFKQWKFRMETCRFSPQTASVVSVLLQWACFLQCPVPNSTHCRFQNRFSGRGTLLTSSRRCYLEFIYIYATTKWKETEEKRFL